MNEPVKFYTDEHISDAVVNGLRQRGVDVLTVLEAGKLEADDRTHFEFAKQKGRVIFTQDDDFLRLACETEIHAGVVYAPQKTSIAKIVRGLLLIAKVLETKDMRNHIEFI